MSKAAKTWGEGVSVYIHEARNSSKLKTYTVMNDPVQGSVLAFLRYGCLQRRGDAWPLDLLWELEACLGVRLGGL